jgi:hypothetical protein
LEVILMLCFGFPEVARQNHFGHDLARSQAGSPVLGHDRAAVIYSLADYLASRLVTE